MGKEKSIANKMCPSTLDEIVGQDHIIKEDKLFRELIATNNLSSLIFYGSPGTGKTTIATVIANTIGANFVTFNASIVKKTCLQQVIAKAKEDFKCDGKKTILFLDDIHLLVEEQKDFLLPFIENKLISLIGATIKNPHDEVDSDLVLRSVIFEVKPLTVQAIKTLLLRALKDRKRGFGNKQVTVSEEVLDFISRGANGNASLALNILELAVLSTPTSEDGTISIGLKEVFEQV